MWNFNFVDFLAYLKCKKNNHHHKIERKSWMRGCGATWFWCLEWKSGVIARTLACNKRLLCFLLQRVLGELCHEPCGATRPWRKNSSGRTPIVPFLCVYLHSFAFRTKSTKVFFTNKIKNLVTNFWCAARKQKMFAADLRLSHNLLVSLMRARRRN